MSGQKKFYPFNYDDVRHGTLIRYLGNEEEFTVTKCNAREFILNGEAKVKRGEEITQSLEMYNTPEELPPAPAAPKKSSKPKAEKAPEAPKAEKAPEAPKASTPSGYDDSPDDHNFVVKVILNGKTWGVFGHSTKKAATKKARRVIRKAALGFTVKQLTKAEETTDSITWSK